MAKPMKPLGAFKPLGALQALRPLVQAPSSLGETDGKDPEEIALTDHQKMMKQLREQQQAAIEAANDTDYFIAVYFQNSKQKREFFDAMKLSGGGVYVDGLQLAERCNVQLTPRTIKYKTEVLDKKCAAMARKHGEQ